MAKEKLENMTKPKRMFEKSNLLLALAQVRLHKQNAPPWVKNL